MGAGETAQWYEHWRHKHEGLSLESPGPTEKPVPAGNPSIRGGSLGISVLPVWGKTAGTNTVISGRKCNRSPVGEE